jgi:ATP-binding cassette subfamily F protein 3
MIIFKDICVSFGGRILFEDVNFAINRGEKIGLIGRNGSGKSTFLKLILKEVQADYGEMDIPEGYKIGYLSQHLHFTHSSVMEEVCSVLDDERAHEEWKGEDILLGLGFTQDMLFDSPQNLSGGYQIKLNLAKLLLMEPNMLMLDEPTNYLDIYSIRWLRSFLKKWDGELILITHDRAFMDSVISHTVIIHRNLFRKIEGKTGKIKEQIATEEKMYELNRERVEKKRKEMEEWIRRFGSKASMASRAQSMQKRLEKQGAPEKLAAIEVLDFNFNFLDYHSSSEVMKVENLSFGYEPDKLLIKDLTFNVERSDKICVIGRNGNGKSTLLQLLIDNLSPITGTVKLNPKIKYGYFGQTNISRLNPNLTIAQEMATAGENLPETTVRRACGQMLFPGDLAYKKISVLSGGEKGRVMLGKILLTSCNLLLLDEPTNHFDIESSESLMDAIKNYPGAVVMVTHDEYFLQEIATKLIVFDGGKTFVFEGGYRDFLKKVGWAE